MPAIRALSACRQSWTCCPRLTACKRRALDPQPHLSLAQVVPVLFSLIREAAKQAPSVSQLIAYERCT